ncbi:phosphate ABC transporter substrate-binding protein [Aquibacillus sp. 3ASR75-11]|uniref:Phosphate-binding protein n=1 Tax=Terrihalobacillus insolitus TaxID=2950438 RepID=A0A9X3WS18_9BACI|nr:phosphate ABC transporter substrate-binding protein [Terrihalobacillus insolitus]MDC3413379.1 phosphate ABC transporter substrate-binding protein [Terrihalobacillus insolitus]MDC3424962.1 phosphate ABC transporter substrate-binding protein [Terrihalobacillus insolitus]
MKKMKQFILAALFLLSIGVLAACGSGEENNDGQENSDSEDSVSGSIVISGSSAMQPLAAAAAEQFTNENPGADIQVNAGGSGTGLSQVSEGSVDIGNSDVFAEEKDGIPADELVDHKVAVVGITAAVNPEVGIDNLSKEDLIKVFTGEITNWSEVGGADQEITLVNRPDSSGTRATFVNFGLDGATPAEGITQDSSNTVKKIIGETPGAIGYLAFSYFTDDSVTPIAIDGVKATDENVQSGAFPIWAYEHSYTKGEPTGLAKQFLDYLMSDEIQEGLVSEQGYIAATKMQVERDEEGNQTDK